MKMNLISTFLLITVIYSCVEEGSHDRIYWAESNAICVHWTDFGKKNFDTKAVRIVLRSRNPDIFSFKDFYLSSNILDDNNILLERVKEIKQIEEYYCLYLYIKSSKLYDLFPKGKNYYNDDCYHIELANMVGQGQILMQKNGESKSIEKSGDYILSVGPK